MHLYTKLNEKFDREMSDLYSGMHLYTIMPDFFFDNKVLKEKFSEQFYLLSHAL